MFRDLFAKRPGDMPIAPLLHPVLEVRHGIHPTPASLEYLAPVMSQLHKVKALQLHAAVFCGVSRGQITLDTPEKRACEGKRTNRLEIEQRRFGRFCVVRIKPN